MIYHGLLTVTMGYKAGNFYRRDAEERREKPEVALEVES
jgi:hypothetical protein